LSALDVFSRAVDRFEIVEAPLEWEPEAEERCRRSLEETGLLLFGETHGIAELPGLLLAVLRRLDVRGLALEWPPDLRALVERFLADGRLEPLPGPQFFTGDGRITAGHFALLRVLRPSPLVLFDEPTGPTDWSGRDFVMAKRFLADWDGASPTLLVAGNLHAELVPHRHGWPLGYHLAQARPGVASIRLDPRSGSFWNLGVRWIAGPPGAGPGRLGVDRDRLVLELPHATPAAVPTPLEAG
jgi:hypothetical protein